MARAIKWRLQFKSLNGTGCLVNIYEEGHTSSADTTKTGANVPFSVESGVRSLVGAAVPFEYQEEDSSDLLDLIRYRTGYIRVVERTYDELADLYPKTMKHHFVEAYYGAEKVFTGYMQQQSFDQPWTAAPRELEFPIISPLGLAESLEFPFPEYSAYQTPDPMVLLGKLLQTAAAILDESYTHVAYPVDPETSGSAALYPWAEKISVLTMTPLNNDFKPYDPESKLYKPRPVHDFLHGVCAAMGWMLHEWPGRLFFASTTCTSCGLLPLSSVAEGSTTDWTRVPGTGGITACFLNCDSDASINTLMPLRKLNLSFEGTRSRSHMLPTNFASSIVHASVFTKNTKWGAFSAMQWWLPTVQSDFGPVDTVQWDGGDCKSGGTFLAFVNYGLCEWDEKTVSPSQFWLAWPGTLGSVNKLLVSYRTYEFCDFGDYLLKICFEVGSNLTSMNATDWGNDIYVYIRMRNMTTGKYLNMQTGVDAAWTTNDDWHTYYVEASTGKIHGTNTRTHCDNDGALFSMPSSDLTPFDLLVEMAVNENSGIDSSWLIKIVEFGIKKIGNYASGEEEWEEFIDKKETTIIGDNAGLDDGSLTVEISNNYRNSNFFRNILASGNTMEAKYAHVFKPYSILTERFRRKLNNYVFPWYAGMYGYWRSDTATDPWYWKLLAHAFNLRDDEVEMTLYTPNVSYVFVQSYRVTWVFEAVSATLPSNVAEHASVEWQLEPYAGYEIDYVQVKMGGTDVTSSVWNASTGKITIGDVTGAIEITATAAAETYTVSNLLDNVTNSNAATTATGGGSYQATLSPAAHYAISSVVVLMDGVDVTSSVYNSSTGVINIQYVTGDISITASASASEVMLTQTLTHVTSSVQDGYVPIGSALQVTYSEDSGYHINSGQTKVYMGGVDVTSSVIGQSSTGIVMYISNVTGPVVVTVVAEQVLPYDAVVEYLQGDGAAYIDTGINFQSSQTVTEIKVIVPSIPSSTSILWGAFMDNNPKRPAVQVGVRSEGKWHITGFPTTDISVSGASHLGNITLNTLYTITVTYAAQPNGTNATAYVFARNNDTGAYLPSNVRIYGLKITKGNTLMRDFIPVRKNGVGYLYDKVSETLFGNAAASGAFTYGNDVNT